MQKEHVELLAQEVLHWPPGRKWKSKDMDRRFKSMFGCSSVVTANLWNRIKSSADGIDSGGQPKHLLWALVFLKNHSCIEILCCVVGWPNATTFSKWAWCFVDKIAESKDDLIRLDDRFEGLDGVATTNCFISVDGADCPVFEPTPFSTTIWKIVTCKPLRNNKNSNNIDRP